MVERAASLSESPVAPSSKNEPSPTGEGRCCGQTERFVSASVERALSRMIAGAGGSIILLLHRLRGACGQARPDERPIVPLKAAGFPIYAGSMAIDHAAQEHSREPPLPREPVENAGGHLGPLAAFEAAREGSAKAPVGPARPPTGELRAGGGFLAATVRGCYRKANLLVDGGLYRNIAGPNYGSDERIRGNPALESRGNTSGPTRRPVADNTYGQNLRCATPRHRKAGTAIRRAARDRAPPSGTRQARARRRQAPVSGQLPCDAR